MCTGAAKDELCKWMGELWSVLHSFSCSIAGRAVVVVTVVVVLVNHPKRKENADQCSRTMSRSKSLVDTEGPVTILEITFLGVNPSAMWVCGWSSFVKATLTVLQLHAPKRKRHCSHGTGRGDFIN